MIGQCHGNGALFDIGIGATGASNVVHKVPIESRNLSGQFRSERIKIQEQIRGFINGTSAQVGRFQGENKWNHGRSKVLLESEQLALCMLRAKHTLPRQEMSESTMFSTVGDRQMCEKTNLKQVRESTCLADKAVLPLPLGSSLCVRQRILLQASETSL